MSWGNPDSRALLSLVPLCFMMCRCEPLRSSGYGHMADGFRAEQAVHRTACSWVDGPPFSVKNPPDSRLTTVNPTRTHGADTGPASAGQEVPPVDVGAAGPASLPILHASRDAPTSGVT